LIYFWSILAYLSLLIVVGVARSGKVKTQTDFMVAGRRLTAPILVGTLLATWIGSGSIIAGAGLAYNKGLPALWFDAGVWVAIIILYLVAPRARRFAEFTVPDILEARYNKYARVFGTVTTIIAYTAIVSYQFKAGAMVLKLVAGVPEQWGLILTALFVIGYTALAGMISVAYTDVVNGIVMIIGIAVTLPFLVSHAGGWSSVAAHLPKERFSAMGGMSPREAIGYALPTMLLLLGESNMYQRFFSAKNEKSARNAVLGWIFGTIVLETMIVLVAVVGSSMYPDINAETVILHAARFGLPLALGCLLLAAIVSVIVSTADSFLLVPTTNIMRDIYQRFINPDLPQEKMVRYSRVVVVLLGAFAFLQVRFFQTVLSMALYAYTVYGVAITPATLAAFFWKRATARGAMSSILLGTALTICWEALGKPFGIPTVYPGLLVSLASLFVVSLLGKPPSEEILERFHGKKAS